MADVAVHQLQNKHWQIGILPETGASIAYARVRYGGVWVDVMRPTAPSDYGDPSNTASFVMIPWANRIRDGKLRFNGTYYQLSNLKPDGSATHGDVRQRQWKVSQTYAYGIQLRLDSTKEQDVNFPFKFFAEVEYRLKENDFVMSIRLKNIDHQPFPAGFGFHPYFVKGEGTNGAHVHVPCDLRYELSNALPTSGIPEAIPERLDFRELRPIADLVVDDVFTGRQGDSPAQIFYPDWNIRLDMLADDIYMHYVYFAPAGKSFFALEPQTNVNDGFNLYDKGIGGTGVFLLNPGQEKRGTVRLRVQQETT